ncbi:MAG: hypothetical protein ACRD3N_15240 [Terracidiphilus sp.]
MKSRIRLSAALLSLAAVATCFGIYSKNRAEAASRPQEPQKYTAASPQPAVRSSATPASEDAFYGPSFDSLAWALFLEAMAPANGHLTVEAWPEECRLNPRAIGCPSAAIVAAAAKAGSDGKVLRVLHASPVAGKMAGSDCSAMRTAPVGGYPPPSNLTRNAMFCEEVHVSPPEAAFLKRSGLTTLIGQQTYGNAHDMAINFPGTGMNDIRRDLDSVEVKLDWAPATSFSKPTFACPDPANHLYTETIDGTCYALVGIHITSKSMVRWLWATFEPNSGITNPNRCDPKLYGACLDSWGTTSSQPYGKGQTAEQSEELHQAMAAAHLNPAFNNYFLTGVQAEFVSGGKPTVLGNSFVEFNQGVPPGKSSCITCHQYAAFDGKQPAPGSAEDNFGRPPQGWPYIGYACNQNQNGNCIPTPPHSTTQDFSWMLGLMPYNNAGAKPRADKSPSAPKNESSLAMRFLRP